MSIKKEASGRRSIELQVEVPGTPDEVWEAIATGPGISAWFVPATAEEQDGKPVAFTLDFGPGQESRSVVKEWNPPQRIVREGPGWVPGSPPIATEFSVEAKGGDICIVRVVQSLFASTDDWDGQLIGSEEGWPGIMRILQLYMSHFRGQRAAIMRVMAPVSGAASESWASLVSALGLEGKQAGDAWKAPSAVPALGGVVERITDSPAGALLRLEQPAPGIGALFLIEFGDTVMAALTCYLYGEDPAAAVVRETPAWESWFQERFAAPNA